MIKTITLTGNAETVGYAVDTINDKKIRYEVDGEKDGARFTDYEVRSINLLPSKKDPYHLIAKVRVKASTLDIVFLSNLISKAYKTLKVKV
jgi:hypothetical protein